MSRQLFEQGYLALLRRDFAGADRVLTEAVNLPGAGMDGIVLLGAARFLAGDEEGARGVFRDLNDNRVGRVPLAPASDDFYEHFGRITAALGEERGDALARFLQRHRVLPWQEVGRLGAEEDWTAVDPWNYTGEGARFFPRTEEFGDLRALIEKHVLPGWLPELPPFTRESAVLALGSSFAQNMRNCLCERGLTAGWLFVPEGMNNSYALRNFIDWCVTGERSADAYPYDARGEGGATSWTMPAEHERYRRALRDVSGIVLNVGLAEVWYDTQSGGVFWRGVPKSIFDPARHKCRLSTVAENRENLSRIVRTLRDLRSEFPVVISLSPVPLRASFGHPSVIAADCVSKSILRVAIHELLGEGHRGLHYWPAFEIAHWLGSHLEESLFGEDGNPRHVNRKAVRLAVESFIQHYYAGVPPLAREARPWPTFAHAP